jgi:cystathionine beta-lyase/cystathionine gamma-synthase
MEEWPMAENNPFRRDETLCIQGEHVHARGALVPPIYQTATFRFETTRQVKEFARGESSRYMYTRYANPTLESVEARITALEQGERAYLFASGSAATAAFCHACLRSGDRLVAAQRLYGGTAFFLNECLRPLGVEIEYADFTDLDHLASVLPGARACWFETPTNPTLGIVDGAKVAALCRNNQVISAVDNTFATPINQKPLAWGIDWVMHSATKYLNGHSDLIGGVLVAGAGVDHAGAERVRIGTGGIMDPHAAFLLDRGMKTLALRVERHNTNALALAVHLSDHPKVSTVHYPGLSSHPGHSIAAKQMLGFGGMLTLELAGGYAAAEGFVDGLKLIANAASLGGVESLVSLPILTSHADATPQELQDAGVTDATVRVSVGIEAIEDLKDDVDSALAAV